MQMTMGTSEECRWRKRPRPGEGVATTDVRAHAHSRALLRARGQYCHKVDARLNVQRLVVQNISLLPVGDADDYGNFGGVSLEEAAGAEDGGGDGCAPRPRRCCLLFVVRCCCGTVPRV